MDRNWIPKVALYLTSLEKENFVTLLLDYIREREAWQLYLIDSLPTAETLRDLRSWGCDGLIVHCKRKGEFGRVLATDIPTVIIEPPPDLPAKTLRRFSTTHVDNDAIGGLAARFLSENGHTSFAYLGDRGDSYWSVARGRAFARALAEQGQSCPKLPPSPAALRRALLRLPKPCALFAANDHCARQALEIARAAGIAVPESLAVLGVDDTNWICESTIPTLSSITLDKRSVYRDVFSHLSRRMRAARTRPRHFNELPAQVHMRASTGLIAVGDSFVDQARAFIRANQGLCTVADIVRAVGCSRRYLEMRFKRVMRRTLLSEIHARRLTRLRELLRTTDLPAGELATRCGFSGIDRATAAFKRAYGQTIRDFRFTAAPSAASSPRQTRSAAPSPQARPYLTISSRPGSA